MGTIKLAGENEVGSSVALSIGMPSVGRSADGSQRVCRIGFSGYWPSLRGKVWSNRLKCKHVLPIMSADEPWYT